MKTIISLLAALLISLTAVSAQTKAKTETTKFNVSMTCNNCKANIEKNIPFEKGVKDLQVNLAKKEVTVTYDPTKTSKADLIKAFEKLKFKASVVEPAKK